METKEKIHQVFEIELTSTNGDWMRFGYHSELARESATKKWIKRGWSPAQLVHTAPRNIPVCFHNYDDFDCGSSYSSK